MGVVDTSQLLSLPPPPAPDIRTYYGLYSRDIWPLCDFKVLPDDVFAVPLANGDIALELSDGHEPSFDVIGAVEGFCFEPPHGFPKFVIPSHFFYPPSHSFPTASFPFFPRWIKVSGVRDPLFAAALDAGNGVYNLMALQAQNVLPRRRFFVEHAECLRPSAGMLTSLETNPNATAVEIPPLTIPVRFEAAIQAGHGRYIPLTTMCSATEMR